MCRSFLRRLVEAFSQLTVKFQCIYVTHLYDIWAVVLQPGRMGKFKTLNKHHSFKVERNAKQQVAVWYKLWSRHRVWKLFQQDMNGYVQG